MPQEETTQARKNPEMRMSLSGHVDEIRVRLMRSLYVFVAGFAVAYYFSEPMMAWLREPLFQALPEGQQKLYYTGLFENFLTHLKIAGYASLFLGSPFYFYQFWKFLAPGLKDREKKWVLPFALAAAFFFVAGAVFAYYVLFPIGFKFFVEYGGPADQPLLTMDSFYSTALKLMMLFGLGFELPVIISFLGFLGLVDAGALRKNRRYAIIGIAVAAALFAPPDAVSMLLLMAPLILLFEGSIWVVHGFGRNRKTKAADQVEPPKHQWTGKSEY